ncbi:hypothetical protein RHECNPAF_770083 [Rhizobium etli CNPAF512]|nr:hypothetical protein RHECNPAF_770083 [Rhizobium etli CNPAF512]
MVFKGMKRFLVAVTMRGKRLARPHLLSTQLPRWRWGGRRLSSLLIPVLPRACPRDVTGIQPRRVRAVSESILQGKEPIAPNDLGALDSCNEHRNEGSEGIGGSGNAAFAASARIPSPQSGGLFQVLLPVALGGEAVHLGAVGEFALAGGDIFRLAVPGLEGAVLQGAAIGEGDEPGQVKTIDRGKMRGRLFRGLAAGEESDAGNRRRNRALQHLDGALGNFLDRCLAGVLAVDDHVRLQDHAFEADASFGQFLENDAQGGFSHFGAAVDVVVARLAVHQAFRLDDRHDLGFLAESRIASECLSVGADRAAGRQRGRDSDDAAPFGKTGAGFIIFGKAFAKTVEAFGDGFAGKFDHRLGAGIDLDAGNGTGGADDVDEWRAVGSLLVERLFEENDAGDIFLHRLVGAEEHLAVVAAAGFGRFEVDRVETLLDGGGRFIGGKQSPAARNHLHCNVFQSFAHSISPQR